MARCKPYFGWLRRTLVAAARSAKPQRSISHINPVKENADRVCSFLEPIRIRYPAAAADPLPELNIHDVYAVPRLRVCLGECPAGSNQAAVPTTQPACHARALFREGGAREERSSPLHAVPLMAMTTP